MSAAERFMEAFKKAFSGNKELPESEREQMLQRLEQAYRNEPVPTIAVVGEAGVGKSTTLNALFNAGAAVGHSRPTMRNSDRFDVHVFDHSGNKGIVHVLDLPGLGESIQKADEILALYRKVLPAADVILWVHPVNDRMLEFIQRQISSVFAGGRQPLLERLVFGLNKADAIQPGDWRKYASIPSEEQIWNLNDAEKYFSDVISTVLPSGSPPRIVTYSALCRYQLPLLFRLLMDAMPANRKWVLEQRMDLADFRELADPKFLAAAIGEHPRKPKVVPERAAIVAAMTQEDLRHMALRGWTAEEWWERERG